MPSVNEETDEATAAANDVERSPVAHVAGAKSRSREADEQELMQTMEEGVKTPKDDNVEPLQRLRFRDIIFNDGTDRVQVEYFANEKTFKERLQLYFIKNQRSSLRIRLFNVFIKVLSCVLYVVRVMYDSGEPPKEETCDNCIVFNVSDLSNEPTKFVKHKDINFELLLWVDRHFWFWVVQVVVAIISLIETVIVIYISYRGNLLQLITSMTFILEMFTSALFLPTIFVGPWRRAFIPVFLNCWMAKTALEAMLNDLNRAMRKTQSAVSQQVVILFSTLACLIFTGACGIQHLQRASKTRLSLFESTYFIIVTFSTVGYGDIYPDYWLSQAYVMLLIVIMLATLPGQLEKLANALVERQKSGADYSKRRAKYEKHVVLAVTTLDTDVILDFLNEFYAHPRLANFYVILLSPCEVDNSMRMLLQIPLWADRVIYVRGSVLKDADLERVQMAEAEACFIITARNLYKNKEAADQHTILRSWAVKDFAPKCHQYVRIFRPESKMHVRHAEYVVCEDEFKYALLANNCICPGLSTFLTLLLHTSRGEEGQHSSEPWHQIYGKHSGNEIYHIKLEHSKFFGEYEGKSFTYASFHAHRKYGVALIGVQRDRPGATIQLNPGPSHLMRPGDSCYYMSITKEELSTFIDRDPNGKGQKVANTIASIGTLALELQHTRSQSTQQAVKERPEVKSKLKNRFGSEKANALAKDDNSSVLEVVAVGRKPSIAAVPDTMELTAEPNSPELPTDDSEASLTSKRKTGCDACGLICIEEKLMKGFPPVTPYIGTSATLCHLLRHSQPVCCLQLNVPCEHCPYRSSYEYDWPNPGIILAADHASNGLYNFIIPLRAHYRPAHSLNPIVLLLGNRPDVAFLDCISSFPMIYWMAGNLDLDDVLKAGITLTDYVVVVNRETDGHVENHLADCNTIVTVQTIHKMFPTVRMITELSHYTNMRFMQFNAKDLYALRQSKFEKKERQRGSHIAFMFRLPFAAGNVFSANMLDTLLYQAFVKDYLIQFVRLLLGIDQAIGSGYLTSVEITEDDMWIRTYGRLFQKLCAAEADVPIGLYRTKRMDSSTISTQVSLEIERQQQQLSVGDDEVNRRPSSVLDDGGGGRSEEDQLQRRFSTRYLVSERHEITNLVRCRMDAMGINSDDYNVLLWEESLPGYSSEGRGTVSYVVINPSFDLKLEVGDIIYIIKPSLQLTRGGRTPSPRRGLRRSRRNFAKHGLFRTPVEVTATTSIDHPGNLVDSIGGAVVVEEGTSTPKHWQQPALSQKRHVTINPDASTIKRSASVEPTTRKKKGGSEEAGTSNDIPLLTFTGSSPRVSTRNLNEL